MTRTLPFVLILAACTSQDPELRTHSSVTDTLPGGIERVMNHGPSEWSDTNGWRLVLERTIQPAEGDSGTLLNPGWMSLRPDGALLVSDGPPIAVKHFDSNGTFVGTIGREGDGPGEYQSAYPLWLGDTILVQDSRGAGRIVRFDITGTPLGTTPGVCCVGGTGPARDARGIRVLGAGPRDSTQPTTFIYQWIWFDDSGARTDSMVVPETGARRVWTVEQGGGVATYRVPFSASSIAHPLSDGRVLLGFGEEYRIAALRRGGDTSLVFGRSEFTTQPIPDSLRRAALEAMTAPPINLTTGSLDDIPSTYPVFDEIFEDGEGNIWVHRPTAPGVSSRLDVFSPAGVLRGTVAMPTTSEYRRVAMAGDRVAVLDTDALDLPRIRIFRIVR